MDQIVRKSKDFFSKRNRELGIALVALVVLLVVVFVPMLIYSKGNADVLSYYGSILGAVVTAGSLFITIDFTRKQIAYTHYLERCESTWRQVEQIITKALSDISPLNMVLLNMSEGSPQASMQAKILHLQSYALTAKTSLDTIKLYIDPKEYKRIETFIEEITKAIDEFCNIQNDLVQQYSTLAFTNDISQEQISLLFKQVDEINSRILTAHSGTYQKLLNMKRDVFRQIYAEIDLRAQQMLLFKRRPPHAHS